EQTVAWNHYPTTTEAIEALHAAGYTVLAIEQVEGAEMLHTARFADRTPLALVFGNEVEGVAQEAVDMCDGAIEIPQVGTKHSLNVAVSGGAVLWEVFRTLSREI
ncbi:MAG: TrmH family RNA methyltransferase, partial [Tidjanibacter sp.]|nr:TrmH family RNA methyltransferase [Tidjanibacter sp.]